MLRVIKELPSSTSKVATGQAKEVGLSIPTAERYIRQWLDNPKVFFMYFYVNTATGEKSGEVLARAKLSE